MFDFITCPYCKLKIPWAADVCPHCTHPFNLQNWRIHRKRGYILGFLPAILGMYIGFSGPKTEFGPWMGIVLGVLGYVFGMIGFAIASVSINNFLGLKYSLGRWDNIDETNHKKVSEDKKVSSSGAKSISENSDSYFNNDNVNILLEDSNDKVLTQLLQKNIQNQKEFWQTFSKSLHSPISIWNESANTSSVDWAKLCVQAPDFIGYLNIIIQSSPVFKGEYPVCYADDTGMILTNYRLFCNFSDGLVIIPLEKLSHYGEIKGKNWLDDDVFKIIFMENSSERELSPSQYIIEDYVNRTKNKKEWEILPKEMIELLPLTYFELERKFNINIDKVKYLP